MGKLPRSIDGAFFPVIYDTFTDLCAKFHLYMSFLQVRLVFGLILFFICTECWPFMVSKKKLHMFRKIKVVFSGLPYVAHLIFLV